MNPMQPQELKTLVETGAYKPDPRQIAMAMLQRHGVRELLTGPDDSAGPGGRTQPPHRPAAMSPRAA
jgi:hypothetical protein